MHLYSAVIVELSIPGPPDPKTNSNPIPLCVCVRVRVRVRVCVRACMQDWLWPPSFDGYLKIKYFWIIFVGCNMVWIIVPLCIYLNTFKELSKLYTKAKQH